MNKPVYISPEVFEAIEDAINDMQLNIYNIDNELKNHDSNSSTYKICKEGVERKRTRVAILKDFLVRHKQIL